MQDGLIRHPLYYRLVGYGLYGFGGLALAVNTRCTAIAYRDGALPLTIGWLFAGLFSAVAIGVGLFLGSPSTWGALWFGFLGTARKAGRHSDRSAPKAVTAILLAVIVVALLAFVAIVYTADWRSTWEYLASLGVAGFYLISACLALIVGPESCFILAHAVIQQGKRTAVPYLLEAGQVDPQIEYLAQVRKGRVKVARDAGVRDANHFQH